MVKETPKEIGGIDFNPFFFFSGEEKIEREDEIERGAVNRNDSNGIHG